MQVRTVTLFQTQKELERDRMEAIGQGARLCQRLASQLVRKGWGVQTRRLATPPWPGWTPSGEIEALAPQLAAEARSKGAQFISLGPVGPKDRPEALAEAVKALQATQVSFIATSITTEHALSLELIDASAQAMIDIGHTTPSGYGNLRLAALANCMPGTPFFPTAYSDPQWERPRVALGLEWCDLALKAFKDPSSKSVESATLRLNDLLTPQLWRLERDVKQGCEKLGLDYGGLDLSLTPAIGKELTVGAALEALGCTMGKPGGLSAVALITGVLRRLPVQRCGYSGVMLPLLEDPLLVQRAQEGHLTLKDLLLYATVCGCGLDTVPLPGDTPPLGITALLVDLATLARRLEKPLSARLFVVPGKAAGEMTEFDSPYLYNGPVLAL